MWAEIKRKFFHLAGLSYVVALIYLPRKTYLILLTCLLAVEFAFESLRLHQPAFREFFLKWFGKLIREEEKTRFSGVFWMLSGVTVTVMLAPQVPIAATALLYLLLGDGVASLVGMRFGGPHWPNSRKRMSGSFACFAVCLFVGSVLLRPYGLRGIVIGAATATVTEFGFGKFDDNFTIPVVSTAALLMSYGLPPIF